MIEFKQYIQEIPDKKKNTNLINKNKRDAYDDPVFLFTEKGKTVNWKVLERKEAERELMKNG